MKKLIILITILLSFSLFAQLQKKSIIVDFTIGKVQIQKINTTVYKDISKNTLIQEGDIIRTGKNSVLRGIDEKGNKYLFSANTTIKISSLKEEKSDLQLYTGATEFNIIKIKQMVVRTPTIVAGVRGTIFKVSSDNMGNDKVVVLQGKVEVGSLAQPDEKPLLVDDKKKLEWKSGEKAFTPALVTAAKPEDLNFQLVEGTPMSEVKQLDEKKMQEAVPIMEEKKLTEAPKKQEPAKNPDENKDFKPLQKKEEKKDDSIFKFNFGAGGIEKNDQLYQSVVFAPEINLGNLLRVGFYIPVYYDGKHKIYYPSYWGNSDEWDFKDSKDIYHDLLVKIKYLKIKERGDLFYLALGNLDSITIGSGFIVNQFNVSPLFPATRVVGLEAGFDSGAAGLSLFANDLYKPEIFGTRLFFRPFYGIPLLGKFQFGFSIAVDKNPGGIALTANNPAIFHYNLDFFLPLMESKDFSLMFFVDYGRQGSYFSDSLNKPSNIQAGWDFNHFHINRYSYGADAGVKGVITQFFNYELRMYYFHDGFEGNYFDSFYLFNRQQKAEVILFGATQDTYAYRFNIRTDLDIIKVNAGFYKKIDSYDSEDRIFLNFKTKRGLIYKFSIEFNYEKKYIDQFFTGNESYKQNAILDIKLGYMISENSDIILRKCINYDQNGNQQSQIMLETNFVF